MDNTTNSTVGSYWRGGQVQTPAWASYQNSQFGGPGNSTTNFIFGGGGAPQLQARSPDMGAGGRNVFMGGPTPAQPTPTAQSGMRQAMPTMPPQGGASASTPFQKSLFNPTTGQYNTGITNGYLPSSQINSALDRLTAPQSMPSLPGSTGMSGDQASAMGGQFADLARQNNAASAVNFGREAAQTQADMNLAYQKANANAGLGWGNILARLNEQNSQSQSPFRNMLASAMGGLF